jgi:hypothetical protein
LGKQASQRSSVLVDKRYEGLQSGGLLTEISCWPNHRFELFKGYFSNGSETQRTSGAQSAQRDFDILPRRILREIGSDDYFKAGAGWPPVLRSPGIVQGAVVCADLFLDGSRSHGYGVQCRAMGKCNRSNLDSSLHGTHCLGYGLAYLSSCPSGRSGSIKTPLTGISRGAKSLCVYDLAVQVPKLLI